MLSELDELIDELEDNPFQGTPLGNEVYKIRVGVASKGKGKSGGVRVMTNVLIVRNTVYLFSIYNKGEKDTLIENEITRLLKEIPK